LKKSRKKFNWANISRIPDNVYGIYSIWTSNLCIYVGQAKRQGIRNRLVQHYNKSHNDDLTRWINSSVQLYFEYEIVSNKIAIDAKERNRIKQFSPLTNKLLLKKEFDNGIITCGV